MTDPWNAPDPAQPADPWSTPDAPTRALVDSYAEDRAKVPRAANGRYILPGADGTRIGLFGRTRVTTTAKVGQDTSRLQARAERLVLQGAALDPSIAADAMRANAMEPDSKEQRKALQAVAARAFARAGGHDRANRGTVIHGLVEDVKRGNKTLADVPEDLQPDVAAYFRALDEHHLEPLPEFMERVVVCPFEHGGAVDDIMRRWNPVTEAYELVVVDTKTGRTLDYGKLSIASQLWLYANAYYFWVTTSIETNAEGKITGITGYAEDLPVELRRDKVLVIHLDGLGSAEVHEIDISGQGRIVAMQVGLRQADSEAGQKWRSLGRTAGAAFVTSERAVPAVYLAGQVAAAAADLQVADRLPPIEQGPPMFTLPGGGLEPRSSEPTHRFVGERGPEPMTRDPYAGMINPDPSDLSHGYADMIDRTFGDRATPTMREQAAAADARAPIEGPVVALGGAANDALIENTAQLDGAGKPLGPLADKSKGERGCSVCGRKGHKSTSKVKGTDRLICLGDQDPAKVKDRAARDVHAAVAPVLNGDRAATPALGTEPIQPHEDGPSPSDMVAAIDAQARAQGRNDDPDDGVPDYQVGDTVTVGGIPFTKHAEMPTMDEMLAAGIQPGQTFSTGPYDPSLPITGGPIPAGPPAAENNCDHLRDGDWHPYVPGQCNPAGPFAADSADGDDAPPLPPVEPVGPYAPTRAPAALPYCDGSHPGPCGWHADPQTGDYVCATSGKPSRMVWELRQAGTVAEPVDQILGQITTYLDPAALLQFRQTTAADGRWTPEHEAACFTHYQHLMGQRG